MWLSAALSFKNTETFISGESVCCNTRFMHLNIKIKTFAHKRHACFQVFPRQIKHKAAHWGLFVYMILWFVTSHRWRYQFHFSGLWILIWWESLNSVFFSNEVSLSWDFMAFKRFLLKPFQWYMHLCHQGILLFFVCFFWGSDIYSRWDLLIPRQLEGRNMACFFCWNWNSELFLESRMFFITCFLKVRILSSECSWLIRQNSDFLPIFHATKCSSSTFLSCFALRVFCKHLPSIWE